MRDDGMEYSDAEDGADGPDCGNVVKSYAGYRHRRPVLLGDSVGRRGLVSKGVVMGSDVGYE